MERLLRTFILALTCMTIIGCDDAVSVYVVGSDKLHNDVEAAIDFGMPIYISDHWAAHITIGEVTTGSIVWESDMMTGVAYIQEGCRRAAFVDAEAQQTTVIHELGHILGLEHVERDADNLMNPSSPAMEDAYLSDGQWDEIDKQARKLARCNVPANR